MSTCIPVAGPPRSAARRFLVVLAAAVCLAAASARGFLPQEPARRGVGLILALLLVVVGNLLPKLRPLRWRAAQSAEAAASARFAGWALVLAGLTCAGLFLLAPLASARPAAGALMLAALLAIAWNWGTLARRRPFAGGFSAPPGAVPTRERALTAWLLFGFAYVIASASAAYLLPRAAAIWLTVALPAAYALLYALVESRRTDCP